MRPLKLIMTGFESYKNKTEIDFENFGTKGLYLITGDTGAGKTTIFDAITFALYGTPSGSDRTVEMLRSHFADENTPTEVELDFEANGKKYHIKRNPDYERKVLRGEGTTIEAANAILTFLSEDKTPVSGVSKVLAEVENILHLKKEQFCSIAMIAQGSFQKLLISKKEEKSKIFRELFHTEKYELLQKKLLQEKGSADGQVLNLKNQLKQALSIIEVNETDEDAEKIKTIKDTAFVKDDEIQLLQAFVERDEELLSDLGRRTQKVEKKLEDVNKNLQICAERKTLETEILKSENVSKLKNEALIRINSELETAEEEGKELPDLEKEKTLLEASLKNYEEIEKAEKELKAQTEKIAADNSSRQMLEKNKADINSQLETLKAEQLELKNAGEKIGTIQAGLEKITQKQNELREIKKQVLQFNSDKEGLALAQENARKSIVAADQASSLYTERLRLFNLEQAGILAAELKKGCPCPVCGSTEHPKPASKSEKAPSQQEIEEAKENAEKLQKDSSELSKKAGELKGSVEKTEEAINKTLENQFENLTIEDEEILDKLEKRFFELEGEKKKLKEELELETGNKKRRDQLEEKIPDLEDSLKNVEGQLSQLQARISAEQAKLESEQKNLDEKKSGLKYETLEIAQSEFLALEDKIKGIRENLENTKKNKADCLLEIGKLEGTIKGLQEQLAKTQPVDEEKLLVQKAEFTAQKDSLNIQRDSLNNRKGKNHQSLLSVQSLVPEITKAEERRNMISALYEVAAGTNRGKNGKPSLETFVQMHCLDHINRRANIRFKTMTANKYELCRRIEEDGAELGLDLNIKDFYTGRERHVQTLSGGEQFQASLSLALGLADEVQETSGGIKLDAMFIDEGFGTLDSETLSKAMRALEDLSQGDKLVGIISHVEELESRIPLKISVKKDEAGVSHAELIKD